MTAGVSACEAISPACFFFLLLFITLFISAGRREDSEDKGSLPDRQTVTSILRFRPTARDNLANIACEAQHPALTKEPLRAFVKMFVQCELQTDPREKI